jgi:hypothetical protein
MSLKPTTWEFTAETPEQLTKVRQYLPKRAKATVAGELFQMVWLLQSLAKTDLLAYPFKARHTGENGVPDFQLESGCRRLAVEIAKVTTTNLEHARSLQMRFPDPPSHYGIDDLCSPQTFTWKLKADRDDWYRFVATRLPAEFRSWLSTWNGKEEMPDKMKELLVATLNSIIDGPAIENDPVLVRAFPRPTLFRVEGFPCEETPRDRKSWLDDALWEEMAVPINPTLMVSPFIRKNDSRMSRKEVLANGFFVPPFDLGGPTLEEEHHIWVDRVWSEVQDKTTKLAAENFSHGEEDWLVLWDRLGSADWQLAARAEAVSQRLASLWKPGWFSRVFIQDQHFEWQLMFAIQTALGNNFEKLIDSHLLPEGTKSSLLADDFNAFLGQREQLLADKIHEVTS